MGPDVMFRKWWETSNTIGQKQLDQDLLKFEVAFLKKNIKSKFIAKLCFPPPVEDMKCVDMFLN